MSYNKSHTNTHYNLNATFLIILFFGWEQGWNQNISMVRTPLDEDTQEGGRRSGGVAGL